MKKLFIIAVFIFLSGCANFRSAYTTLTNASVSQGLVIAAVNSFDAVEATATNYLRLPKCRNGGPAVCRSPIATKRIIPAVRSGRLARINIEQFYKDNPGALGPAGLYNALVTATNTLQSVVQQYNIGSGQ